MLLQVFKNLGLDLGTFQTMIPNNIIEGNLEYYFSSTSIFS